MNRVRRGRAVDTYEAWKITAVDLLSAGDDVRWVWGRAGLLPRPTPQRTTGCNASEGSQLCTVNVEEKLLTSDVTYTVWMCDMHKL